MGEQGRYANDLEHGRGKRLYPSGDTFEVHHSHAAAALWAQLSGHYCVQGDFRNGKQARFGRYTWYAPSHAAVSRWWGLMGY